MLGEGASSLGRPSQGYGLNSRAGHSKVSGVWIQRPEFLIVRLRGSPWAEHRTEVVFHVIFLDPLEHHGRPEWSGGAPRPGLYFPSKMKDLNQMARWCLMGKPGDSR